VVDLDKYEWRTEVEFITFLKTLLISQYPDAIIHEGTLGGGRLRPDLIMHFSNEIYVIEVKRETPLTGSRLHDVTALLVNYRQAAMEAYPGRVIHFILAIPGVLSADKHEVITGIGYDVWDKNWIIRAVEDGPVLRPPREPTDRAGQCRTLLERHASIEPGKPAWSEYQKICMEIWECLFLPELSRPISESANESGVNRRDFVVPNYATDGFWAFMRSHYHADYIVVDAKNLVGLAGKAHVLQISNYMSRRGTGLFGVIMTRRGSDRAALYTRREQWVLYGKMLIVLDDDDTEQMLDNAINGDEPSLVLRQKIEDFRLSL
jgi:hypothetical protein